MKHDNESLDEALKRMAGEYKVVLRVELNKAIKAKQHEYLDKARAAGQTSETILGLLLGIQHSALLALLIQKGVITETEYAASVIVQHNHAAERL